MLFVILSSVEKCKESIANLDEDELSSYIDRVNGKTKFLVRAANTIVAYSTDPVYRNGVLAHVKQLKRVSIISIFIR